MICLDGMDPGNGATTFAVGSHFLTARPNEDTTAQMSDTAEDAARLPAL